MGTDTGQSRGAKINTDCPVIEIKEEYARLMGLDNKRVIDENAFSVQELADRWNLAYSTASHKAQTKCRSGEFEQVWKRGKDRLIPAYRPKGK